MTKVAIALVLMLVLTTPASADVYRDATDHAENVRKLDYILDQRSININVGDKYVAVSLADHPALKKELERMKAEESAAFLSSCEKIVDAQVQHETK